jgi:hypothetical protein
MLGVENHFNSEFFDMVMPFIQFVSLKCIELDDDSEYSAYDTPDVDEPYLLVDGNKVWSGRMVEEEVEDLSGVKPVEFNERICVELWEKDPGLFGEDDLLGKLFIEPSSTSSGTITEDLTSGTTKYVLKYKVI